MPRFEDTPLPKGGDNSAPQPKVDKTQSAPGSPGIPQLPKKLRTPCPRPLDLWKVLLHSDDENDAGYQVHAIASLTPLDEEEAQQRTREAAHKGRCLLLTTHQERAELYERQFGKANMRVTIEPIRA